MLCGVWWTPVQWSQWCQFRDRQPVLVPNTRVLHSYMCCSCLQTLATTTHACYHNFNMQKFYWNNQQQHYNEKLKSYHNQSNFGPKPSLYNDFGCLTLDLSDENQCLANGDGRTKTKIVQDKVFSIQVRNDSLHQIRSCDEPNNNKVVLRLGDTSSIYEVKTSSSPSQHVKQYNRTWNENIKSQYSNEQGRQRKSVQNPNIFHHDYENVYDDNDSAAMQKKCPSSSARSTPRARKKKKQQHLQNQIRTVYRSKSCERVPSICDEVGSGFQDKWPEKFSINCSPVPPPTPTPSLLQSVAARAIPCVDIKAPCMSNSSDRLSPTDSVAYENENPHSQDISKELLRPAANLAGRMRGRLEYVNKKMKIIRSRSAERLRGYMRSGQETVDSEWDRSPRLQYNNVDNYSNLPVLGQARAIVKSPPFNVGDVIDILQTNPNGLWRGRCGERVGQFKFVNVEMIARHHGRSSRSRSKSIHEKSIVSIYQVMRIMDLEEYLPVFVLNGYEDMSLFKDLDDQELNYLGIQDVNHRQQLIEMAGFLFPDENKNIKDG